MTWMMKSNANSRLDADQGATEVRTGVYSSVNEDRSRPSNAADAPTCYSHYFLYSMDLGAMTEELRDKSEEIASSVDFSELIFGFSSAALYYMGQGTVDGKRVGSNNLPLAKQNIEIISMLAEKTKGNLSAKESALIAQVLADLRQKYQAAKK